MKAIKLKKIDFLTKENFIQLYNGVPKRMAWIAPEAYEDLLSVAQQFNLVFSDIYRSPASSAEAYRKKNGVAFPGYSGHNYGVSVDIDVETVLKRNNFTYPVLCESMRAYGWTPYQGVLSSAMYKRGKEDWHFNYIGDYAYDEIRHHTNWVGGNQTTKWIETNYPITNNLVVVQTLLKKLKFYSGALDGKLGPLTEDAIKSFKRAWFPTKLGQLLVDPTLDEKTLRLINVVAADTINIDTGEMI